MILNASLSHVQKRQAPTQGRGLKTPRERSSLGSAAYPEPILRLDIPQGNSEYAPSRRTLSHGAETGLHARKPLFRVQVAHFLPGRSPLRLMELRKETADSRGDPSTPALGAGWGKGLKYV